MYIHLTHISPKLPATSADATAIVARIGETPHCRFPIPYIDRDSDADTERGVFRTELMQPGGKVNQSTSYLDLIRIDKKISEEYS